MLDSTKNSNDSLTHVRELDLANAAYKSIDSIKQLQLDAYAKQIVDGQSIDSIKIKAVSIIDNLSTFQVEVQNQTKELIHQQQRQIYAFEKNPKITFSLSIELLNKQLIKDYYESGGMGLIMGKLRPYFDKFVVEIRLPDLVLQNYGPFVIDQFGKRGTDPFPPVPQANLFILSFNPQTNTLNLNCDLMPMIVNEDLTHAFSILDLNRGNLDLALVSSDGNPWYTGTFDGSFLNSDSISVKCNINFMNNMGTAKSKSISNNNEIPQFNFGPIRLYSIIK